MPEIRVTISKDGQTVKVDAIGYSGLSCEEATKAIETALGVATATDKKPEYYQTVRSDATQTVRG